MVWLSTFLALPNGLPSADTFRRVFERLNPKQFEHCFEQWVNQLVQDLGIQVIAIDGKNLRGSYDRQSGSQALHFVSAWTSEHRLVLAQTKVQDKRNEITMPELINAIVISPARELDTRYGRKLLLKAKSSDGEEINVWGKPSATLLY